MTAATAHPSVSRPDARTRALLLYGAAAGPLFSTVVVVNLALSGVSFASGDFRYLLAGSVALWLWASMVLADQLRAPATVRN